MFIFCWNVSFRSINKQIIKVNMFFLLCVMQCVWTCLCVWERERENKQCVTKWWLFSVWRFLLTIGRLLHKHIHKTCKKHGFHRINSSRALKSFRIQFVVLLFESLSVVNGQNVYIEITWYRECLSLVYAHTKHSMKKE